MMMRHPSTVTHDASVSLSGGGSEGLPETILHPPSEPHKKYEGEEACSSSDVLNDTDDNAKVKVLFTADMPSAAAKSPSVTSAPAAPPNEPCVPDLEAHRLQRQQQRYEEIEEAPRRAIAAAAGKDALHYRPPPPCHVVFSSACTHRPYGRGCHRLDLPSHRVMRNLHRTLHCTVDKNNIVAMCVTGACPSDLLDNGRVPPCARPVVYAALVALLGGKAEDLLTLRGDRFVQGMTGYAPAAAGTWYFEVRGAEAAKRLEAYSGFVSLCAPPKPALPHLLLDVGVELPRGTPGTTTALPESATSPFDVAVDVGAFSFTSSFLHFKRIQEDGQEDLRKKKTMTKKTKKCVPEPL